MRKSSYPLRMFNLNISKVMDEWQIAGLCFIAGCLIMFVIGIMVGKWVFQDNFAETEEQVKDELNKVEYVVGGHYTSPVLPDYAHVMIIYMDDTKVIYKLFHRDRYLSPRKAIDIEKFKKLFPDRKIIDSYDNKQTEASC